MTIPLYSSGLLHCLHMPCMFSHQYLSVMNLLQLMYSRLLCHLVLGVDEIYPKNKCVHWLTFRVHPANVLNIRLGSTSPLPMSP